MVKIIFSFNIIDNVSNIKLSSNWIDSAKFNSKGRTVGENGKPITASYKAKQYRLVSKKERDFTALERIGRGFLGVVAAVCTLGIAILFKSVRKLFTEKKAKIRFAVVVPQSSSSQKPKSVKSPSESGKSPSESGKSPSESGKSPSEYSISEKELQSGVVISEGTISKIQTCMKNILQRKEEGGVKLYNSQSDHRVFSLDTAPEYIFKMKASKNCRALGRDDAMKTRYQTMINALTVCRTHGLGLLVIPNAKLFTVEVEGKEYEIIAEKKLCLNPTDSAQEKYFEEYASSLNETIRQLAVFICKTGYSDVEWRNNPVLNDVPDQFGCRKIGLIDIEDMGSKTTGLFGGEGRRGLVGCATEKQGKIIEGVAKKYGVSTSSFASAHARRKEEIEEEQKLKSFYSTKNITTGYETIHVDEDALVFSDYPEKTQELKKLTLQLVNTINEKIQAAELNESTKGRRYILIDVNRGPFLLPNTELIEPGKKAAQDFETYEEFQNATFLGHIVKKLLELKVIHKLVKRNGNGYFIQA
jgi:hypothetical protein